MSLINDALKKASQAQKQQTPAVADPVSARPHSAAAPPMQAAEIRRRSSFPLMMGIFACVVAILICGIFFTWQLMSKKQAEVAKQNAPAAMTAKPEVVHSEPAAEKPAPAPVAKVEVKPAAAEPVKVEPVKPAPAVEPVAEPKPVAVAAAAPAVAPETSATPATPAAPSQSVVAAPTPPPAPTFPLIRLQGIFYSKTAATAMLNGKTLEAGGKVDGVNVTKIDKTSVTLEWNGETKVLELR